MNTAVKKELSLLTGLLAVGARITGSKTLARRLGWISTGFFISGLMPNYSVKHKTAYITGGSRGLGLSLAWNLLAQGAKAVTLVARDEDELARAHEILRADFPEARIYYSVCDVTELPRVTESLSDAIDAMGGIDILVNNAGAILVGPSGSMTREDYEAQLNLHLFAAINTTRVLPDHFKRRRGGRIVNICSMGGKVAVPHMLPYDVSKFALSGFTQGIGAELSPLGVSVTGVYPNVMRTGSPIQAVFKGDHEKEFAWFQTVDTFPGFSMSADLAAKKIIDGIIEGRSEVVLSVPAKARMMFGVFFPETMQLLMGFVSRMLPHGQSFVRKTGADSSSRFDKSFLAKPLRKRAHDAEIEYNQEAHHDADFSLGLKH